MAAARYFIASTTVGSGGASTISFSSIPSTYTDLVLVTSTRSNVGGYGTDMNISINGSSTATGRRIYGYGSGTTSDTQSNVSGLVVGGTATANVFSSNYLYFPNYAGSANKSYVLDAVSENNSASVYLVEISANYWANTAAITSISIADATGATLQQYSTATLYGIKNA